MDPNRIAKVLRVEEEFMVAPLKVMILRDADELMLLLF
jgi:hypothetical protein